MWTAGCCITNHLIVEGGIQEAQAWVCVHQHLERGGLGCPSKGIDAAGSTVQGVQICGQLVGMNASISHTNQTCMHTQHQTS